MYRSFNPFNISPRILFNEQLRLIKNCFTIDTVWLGDLNLNHNRRFDVDYCNANLYDDFELHLFTLNLLQLVNFDTWSRIVGTNLRSSCLDHVYVRRLDLVKNINHMRPCFGDHDLIMLNLSFVRPQPRITVSRNWHNYSEGTL